MAIYSLIANGPFGPDIIEAMKAVYEAAYEAALSELHVVDRNDALTELIAKSIINVAGTSEHHRLPIANRALNGLGVRRSAA